MLIGYLGLTACPRVPVRVWTGLFDPRADKEVQNRPRPLPKEEKPESCRDCFRGWWERNNEDLAL